MLLELVSYIINFYYFLFILQNLRAMKLKPETPSYKTFSYKEFIDKYETNASEENEDPKSKVCIESNLLYCLINIVLIINYCSIDSLAIGNSTIIRYGKH